MENNKSLNTIEIFAEEVSKAIQKSIANVTIEPKEVEKFNESYYGLLVKPEDSNVGVTLNISNVYDSFTDGNATFDEICAHLVSQTREAINHMPAFNLEGVDDYENMRTKLLMEVVSAEANKELLETVPHKLLEDMAIIYRFDATEIAGDGASIVLTNVLLDKFGVSAEQVHQDAVKFAPQNRPLEIKGMGEVLAAQMGVDDPSVLGFDYDPEDEKMFVASVAGNILGAGILAYEEFMDKAAERVGGSFYLLPSSIHEVLLVPDNGTFDLRALENMVREVNATTVDPKEKLTDSVYHYDAEKKLFELGEKYIIRHAEENIA